MRNVLKREKSLERRLIESRGREAELELMITELEDKLSLYDQFFGSTEKLTVTEFNHPETQTSIDVHLRFDPAVPRLEYKPRKYGEPVDMYYHEMLGMFDMCKLLLTGHLTVRNKPID